MLSDDGCKFESDYFLNGGLSHGFIYWKDKTYFHGFIRDFKIGSFGIKFYLDGSSYAGYFIDSKPHNYGTRDMGEKILI